MYRISMSGLEMSDNGLIGLKIVWCCGVYLSRYIHIYRLCIHTYIICLSIWKSRFDIVKMEYSEIRVGRGTHYVSDEKVYVRSSTNKTTKAKYLRYIATDKGCMGRAKSEGNELTITYGHIDHDAAETIGKNLNFNVIYLIQTIFVCRFADKLVLKFELT